MTASGSRACVTDRLRRKIPSMVMMVPPVMVVMTPVMVVMAPIVMMEVVMRVVPPVVMMMTAVMMVLHGLRQTGFGIDRLRGQLSSLSRKGCGRERDGAGCDRH